MEYITGTDGNDILTGSDLEDDFIMGLDGNDTINGGLGSDSIEAGNGGDTVTGSFQDDSIYGDEGNDTLSGNSGSDQIDGGAGKDKLYGGSGRDTLTLGTLATAAGDVVDGGSGTDQLSIDYTLSTTKLNITIKDWIAPQILPGGVQVINVEELRITGSAFADVMTAGDGAVGFYGGDGNDILSGGRGVDNLQGDRGNDVLSGNQGADFLGGGEGDDKIYGGSQSDYLLGRAGADYVSGEAGDDTLVGGEGDDRLHGGSGNDQIDGGAGDDTIEGGAGDDVIRYDFDEGKDTITDASGSDRLVLQGFTGNFTAKAATEVNTLAGGTTFRGMDHYTIHATGTGANKITTSTGNDIVDAGDGNDWINGADGNDTLHAGLGRDTVFGGAGNDTVNLGDGGADSGDGGTGIDEVIVDRRSVTTSQTFSVTGTTATLTDGTSLKNFEHYTVTFGKGNDVIKSVGAAQSVTFYGYDGNDTLIGTNGSDELDGGNGNDTLTSGGGDDIIKDRGGTNVIRSGDGADKVYVGNGSDGTVGHYTVDLGAGDDNFSRSASTGKLNLQAGSGFDSASIDFSNYSTGITFTLSAAVRVTNAPVVINNVEQIGLIGGSGNDVFTGGGFVDFLFGGRGNDALNGGGGSDTLYGELGNDTIKGGEGNDVIYADEYYPYDYYENSAAGGIDRISGDGGDDTVYMGIKDRAAGGSGIDKIVLYLGEQSKDISFVFSTGTVTVDATTSFGSFESIEYVGSRGKDTVTGGALNDDLNGRAGNDILKGGAGNDHLNDGDGNDKLYGDSGDDTLLRAGPSGTDLYDGGSGSDTLYFLGSNSVILDLMAQDRNKGAALGLSVKNVEIIQGGYYDDDIRGDANANIINGGERDDVLQGRGGNDTLNGQEGDDWLTGGTGNDKFVFDRDGRDGEGDVITDFTRGQDKLVIDKSDYNIAKGDTAVTLVVGADPVATSTKGTFLFESDNGRLWFDADGKGTEADLELVAILQNVKTLSTGDFSFI